MVRLIRMIDFVLIRDWQCRYEGRCTDAQNPFSVLLVDAKANQDLVIDRSTIQDQLFSNSMQLRSTFQRQQWNTLLITATM